MSSNGAVKEFVRRNWRTATITLAIFVDVIIIAASFITAGLLMQRSSSLGELLETHQRLLIFSAVVFTVYFTSVGLYRTISYSSFQAQAFRAGKAYVYSTATILCTVFLLQEPVLYTGIPRPLLCLDPIVLPFCLDCPACLDDLVAARWTGLLEHACHRERTQFPPADCPTERPPGTGLQCDRCDQEPGRERAKRCLACGSRDRGTHRHRKQHRPDCLRIPQYERILRRTGRALPQEPDLHAGCFS